MSDLVVMLILILMNSFFVSCCEWTLGLGFDIELVFFVFFSILANLEIS